MMLNENKKSFFLKIEHDTTLTQFDKDMMRLSQANNRISRVQKNQSLYSRTKIHDFVDDYVVFDLETTGYSPKDGEIIEISAIKYKNNELLDTFSHLVKPSNGISAKITNLTGITEQTISNANNIKTILPMFLDFIENYPLVAYNGSFDLSFIEYYINKFNYKMIDNPNIDVLYLAKDYIKETPNYKLETLKEYFNLEYPSHRALDDCYTTNYIYQYCKNSLPITKKDKLLNQHHNNFNYKNYSASINDDTIKQYQTLFTNNAFLNGKNITITGDFVNFNRNELIELLNLSNAILRNSVTKKTNLLIKGNCHTITSKHKRALELIDQGQQIDIIDEDILFNNLKEGMHMQTYEYEIISILENIIQDVEIEGFNIYDICTSDEKIKLKTNNNFISFEILNNYVLLRFFKMKKVPDAVEIRIFDSDSLNALNKYFENVKYREQDEYARISISNINDIEKLSNILRNNFKTLFLLYISNEEAFGCCSKYIECSEKKHCIDNNLRFRLGCLYKKNLDSGKIFYGKNRNIN